MSSLKTWLRCQVSSPRKGVWNCIGLPEEFLLRVVVSYFLVLGCRFVDLSLCLGF